MASKDSLSSSPAGKRWLYPLLCLIFIGLFTFPLWAAFLPGLPLFAYKLERMVVHPQGVVLLSSPPEFLRGWTGSFRGGLSDPIRLVLGLFNAAVGWIAVTVVCRMFLEWFVRAFWLVVTWIVWLWGWYLIGTVLLMKNPWGL